MADSIYGFARSAYSTKSDSSVTNVIRRYNLLVEEGKDQTGNLTDPNIYREARKILEPYADNTQVQLKIADSVNDENRLRERLEDVQFSVNEYKRIEQEALKNNAKSFYTTPSALIAANSYTYNAIVDELENEVAERRASGLPVGELLGMLNTYQDKARSSTRLTRLKLEGNEQFNKAWGWFVKTNPEDGSIISMEIAPVDGSDKKGQYSITNGEYDGIPIWANTYKDEDGNTVARVGANRFEDDDGELKLKDRRVFGRWVKSLLPGGEKPGDVGRNTKQVNFNSVGFSDVANLPKGSVTNDSSGNFYFYGDDGRVYKAEDERTLKEYMTQTGKQVPESIFDISFPVTSEEVRGYGNFSEDRIINENFLGGLKDQQALYTPPALDNEVSGVFKVAGTPSSIPSVGNQTPGLTPFQVPRKEPGLATSRKESINGRTSAERVIAKEQSRFSGQTPPNNIA